MLFVVLCPGTPKGSTGGGSGFKASQKTGQRLKVSSDRLGASHLKLFVAFPWVETSTGPGGFMICVFILVLFSLSQNEIGLRLSLWINEKLI